MIADIVLKLQHGTEMTRNEVDAAMTEMLSGRANHQSSVDFLSNLAQKGETDDELLAMLEKMQEFSLKVQIADEQRDAVIDMCGTGGDNMQTFNVSTTASFVAAAAGGIVAKHGNRSNSGVSGSADIFEYFGYDLNKEPSEVTNVLRENNICFMFAQKFHPAMRHVSSARRQIGKRTVFNLLGPLTNPARVKNQLVGVSSMEYLDRLPAILKKSGSQNVMAVCSENGMDELSTSTTNRICSLKDGKITTYTLDPQDLKLHKSDISEIQIKTKDDAMRSFVGVLNGTANRAMTETAALNAAGGLMVGGITDNFDEGVEIAMNTIKSGKAFKCLKKFITDTGDVSKLENMM